MLRLFKDSVLVGLSNRWRITAWKMPMGAGKPKGPSWRCQVGPVWFGYNA